MNRYTAKSIAITICLLLLSSVASKHLFAQTSMGDPLPDGWYFKNVGQPRGPTIFTYNAFNGTYYIDHQGGGDTGWGTEDNCCMIYFETEEDKEVVCRILNFSSYGNGWNAKGFCMIRSSMEPQASMAYLELRNDLAAIPVYRPTDGYNVGGAEAQYGYTITAPVAGTWMKFIRQGRFVSAFDSKDGVNWTAVGSPRQMVFRGKAYMGIGAAGCSGGARVTFDNLVVRDIQIPYELKDTVACQNMKVGRTNTLDVTTVFGHYLGDYFTIDAASTDSTVATVRSYLATNPAFATNGGDQYLQKLEIKGLKDGVAAIKLSTNIMGFKMSYNFLTVVTDSASKPETITSMDPSPWIFGDLVSTANPSALEFTGNVNKRIKILTGNAGGMAADTVTALYKLFNRTDNLGLIAYVDTVKNTGKGSYAGFMLRDTFSKGVPFVSFVAGAYEGLRFSYRWANNVSITTIDDNSIKLPCWLLLNYSTDNLNNSYFQPYYSYDSIYWRAFLKYPFPLNFTKSAITAGLVVSGGSKAQASRPATAVVKCFNVNTQPFNNILMVDSIGKLKSDMTIAPNPLSSSGTVRFKILQPGSTYLAVYDVYGILKETIFSGYRSIGEYSISYDPSNLKKPGIYLLKLISRGGYETLKFIYQ